MTNRRSTTTSLHVERRLPTDFLAGALRADAQRTASAWPRSSSTACAMAPSLASEVAHALVFIPSVWCLGNLERRPGRQTPGTASGLTGHTIALVRA